MKEVLFLEPVFQEKIWGGNQLQTEYNYSIPSEHTGECWAISGHPHGETKIKNGRFAGQSLAQVYAEHPEVFGEKEEGQVFPLLIKILDAKEKLSVQVHPADDYAAEHEGELGKTECWYVLACEPGAKIVYGHQATTKEELEQMIADQRWSDLLKEVEVHPGDFFYVPSGMVHAIGEGILILETQQSSDTTYRVYDYDRRDAEGNLRDLHLQQALDVISVPCAYPTCAVVEEKQGSNTLTCLAEEQYFSVYRFDIDGILPWRPKAAYTLASVIEGAGSIQVEADTYELQKGDHFILPYDIDQLTFVGKMSLILSNNSQMK